MNKKGVAVWLILVILSLLVLIALIGFVVYYLQYASVSTPILVPKRAVVNPPFYLESVELTEKAITLDIKNNARDTYIIKQIKIHNCGTLTVDKEIGDGVVEKFIVNCESPITIEGFKSNIEITWRKIDSSVDLISTGSMSME